MECTGRVEEPEEQQVGRVEETVLSEGKGEATQNGRRPQRDLSSLQPLREPMIGRYALEYDIIVVEGPAQQNLPGKQD